MVRGWIPERLGRVCCVYQFSRSVEVLGAEQMEW